MKRLIRSRLSGLVLGLVVLSASVCSAGTTVTMPIRQFGLGTLQCAAYSPDGQTILTGGGGGAYLWSVATGKVIRTFSGHTASVCSVAFSPDGTKVLTGSGKSCGGRLSVWFQR
jgi:WD40 repeat protein